MQFTKEQREQLVFKSFAETYGLLPDGTFSSRLSPEPDILFMPNNGPPQTFELVEIIDSDYSRSIGAQLSTKTACDEHLNNLPADQAAAFRGRYSDADIFIGFRNALTLRQRKNSLVRVFEQLMGLPARFVGEAFIDEGPLYDVIDRVAIYRGQFIGPLFDAPSFVRVGDPTIETIARKMTKTYQPKGKLSLLAYIDINPMFPDEIWLSDLDKYFRTLNEACQFQSIYVYDCKSKSIKRTWHRDA